MAETPLRSLRISDDLWEQVRRVASKRGDSITDAAEWGLRHYIKEFGYDEEDEVR